MKIKQLLCLLVLTVSGNTFGSSTTPAMDMNQVAAKHFQSSDKIPTELQVMKKMIDMDNKHMTHPELAKMHRELLIESWNAGRNEAFMQIGTYMQPAMTAMGNHVTASKADVAAIAKAQGFK